MQKSQHVQEDKMITWLWFHVYFFRQLVPSAPPFQGKGNYCLQFPVCKWHSLHPSNEVGVSEVKRASSLTARMGNNSAPPFLTHPPTDLKALLMIYKQISLNRDTKIIKKYYNYYCYVKTKEVNSSHWSSIIVKENNYFKMNEKSSH